MKLLVLMVLSFAQVCFAVNSELATSQPAKSSQTGAAEKPLPASTKGKFLSLKVHKECNEIKTQEGDSLRWVETSSGGSATITSVFRQAKEGILEDINFGKSNIISFRLKGKNLVPDSVNENAHHANAFSSLGNTDGLVGKMIALVEPWNGDKIITTENKEKKQPIHMAAFYINKDTESVPPTVQCSYVSGDLDVKAIENDAKCFWIDLDSVGSNGKPYCW